jgi:hypothetical protein
VQTSAGERREVWQGKQWGESDPISELSRVWDGGREEDDVHMSRQHDNHLCEFEEMCISISCACIIRNEEIQRRKKTLRNATYEAQNISKKYWNFQAYLLPNHAALVVVDVMHLFMVFI